MTPTAAELAALARWTAALLGAADTPPAFAFSFTCGGRPSAELLPGWTCTRQRPQAEDDCTRHTLTWTDPETGLAIRVEATVFADRPALEWVLYLENTGSAESPLLEQIMPLDAPIALRPEEPCAVRYARGALCSVDDFAPVLHPLRPRGRLDLVAGWGRSSSEVLPFFNLELDGAGLILALGWTGQWAAHFTRAGDGPLGVQAGMERTRLRLHPGETIRTPRILLLCWEGDALRGHNLLRRHILAHHRPRPGGEPLVAPLCNSNWGGTPAETHLDNIRQIVAHDLPFEYYWIDAEWFGKPGHWLENAGNWTPRPDLYPEGLRPISDALHAAGRKFLLWFEFERVAPGTPWAEGHDDWLLTVPEADTVTWADYGDYLPPAEWVKWESRRNQLGRNDRLFDLGNPAARRFLTDFLAAKIEEFGIDCLRQDSNVAHLAYWRGADAEDRQGMTEIRYVEGQYQLWDELLARYPHLIIDNCASGGRRIDLESISRATPLWRTDYTVGHRNNTAIQSHTYGLALWVPLNGTGSGYLRDCDDYTLRSTMCSAWVIGLHGHGDASQPKIPEDYPFARARAVLHQYLDLRRYYYGDYYPLTEYSLAEDAWLAYQLDLPESGEGLVVVLKRPLSPYTQAAFSLRGLAPEARYEIEDLDRGARQTLTGATLAAGGLAVELRGKPASALVRYRLVES